MAFRNIEDNEILTVDVQVKGKTDRGWKSIPKQWIGMKYNKSNKSGMLFRILAKQ